MLVDIVLVLWEQFAAEVSERKIDILYAIYIKT